MILILPNWSAALPPAKGMDARSVQPVLHAKTRHLAEVGEVAREQGAVKGERDTRDAEVHRSDADTPGAKFVENVSARLDPRESEPFGETLHALLELRISLNAAIRLRVWIDLGGPAIRCQSRVDLPGGRVFSTPCGTTTTSPSRSRRDSSSHADSPQPEREARRAQKEDCRRSPLAHGAKREVVERVFSVSPLITQLSLRITYPILIAPASSPALCAQTATEVWVNRYDGPAHSGDGVLFPYGKALALKADGGAVVTGLSSNGTNAFHCE